MRSVNSARYVQMARQQRRDAFLCRIERFNGRVAMLAVLAATAAELAWAPTSGPAWAQLIGTVIRQFNMFDITVAPDTASSVTKI